MLGGIGYWYGSSAVAGKSSLALAQRPLFSATPSRPKFPRGFLWDEGFHDLVIASWDPAIARDILSHWSGLITKGGWVAREQILGVEARGRVPGEFIPQHTTHANPPTLLLHLSAQIALLKGGGSDEAKNDAEIVAWLRSVVPALSRWFLWFVRSQSGETPGTFRWRGRTREEGGGVSGEKLHVNTLASGLDDYPRASHPDTRERHVDLYCWIARGAAIMADAAATLAKDDADDAAEWSAVQQRYAELHRTLVANLNRWHWDAVSKSYADFGSHIAGGKIDEFVVFRCAEESSQGTIDVALADGNCPASHPRRLYPLGDGAGGMMKRPVFIPPTNRRGRAAQPELGFVKQCVHVELFSPSLPLSGMTFQPTSATLCAQPAAYTSTPVLAPSAVPSLLLTDCLC
jgi:mannosyl-oligosaccharide glucosidase